MIDYRVRGLPVPPLLIELIQEGKWKHPGNEKIKEVIPFFKENIIFLNSLEFMKQESRYNWVGSDWAHEGIGEVDVRAQNLPWRDINLSFFIAVCESPGDDIAVALDYRTSMTNPRVIGNNWHSDIKGSIWQEISPGFEEFVSRLGIL